VDDKLKIEIASIVTAIFDSKKEEDQREKTQQALETAASNIETLTSKVEDNDKVIATIEEEKTALEAGLVTSKEEAGKEKKEVEDKLEVAEKDLEESKTKFEEVSTELKDLKDEASASARMSDLEEAGILRDDVDSQKAKVKDMTEEEFTSYKEELASIRKSILAEIEEAKKKEAASKNGKEGEENAGEEGEEGGEENASEEGVKTPPAEINTSNAISAAMNMEIQPSADLLKEYASLGDALAAQFTNKEEGGV
jgi:hypothetical protein